MYELLRNMRDTIGLNYPDIDPEALVGDLGSCYNNGVIWLAEREGKVVGILGLQPQRFRGSKAQYLADDFFYVHPDYRKSRIAAQLIDEAKKYADDKKLPLIMAVLNAVDIERKAQFMERKGLKSVGGFFAMGLS